MFADSRSSKNWDFTKLYNFSCQTKPGIFFFRKQSLTPSGCNSWRRQDVPDRIFIFCFRKISRKTCVLRPGIPAKHPWWLDTSIWLTQILICTFISYYYRSCSIRSLKQIWASITLIFYKIPLYVIKTKLKTK